MLRSLQKNISKNNLSSFFKKNYSIMNKRLRDRDTELLDLIKKDDAYSDDEKKNSVQKRFSSAYGKSGFCNSRQALSAE